MVSCSKNKTKLKDTKTQNKCSKTPWKTAAKLRFYAYIKSITLPETNSSHLKMDGWKMTFPLGARPIFRGELLVLGSVLNGFLTQIGFVIQANNRKKPLTPLLSSLTMKSSNRAIKVPPLPPPRGGSHAIRFNWSGFSFHELWNRILSWKTQEYQYKLYINPFKFILWNFWILSYMFDVIPFVFLFWMLIRLIKYLVWRFHSTGASPSEYHWHIWSWYSYISWIYNYIYTIIYIRIYIMAHIHVTCTFSI